MARQYRYGRTDPSLKPQLVGRPLEIDKLYTFLGEGAEAGGHPTDASAHNLMRAAST